MRQSGIEPEAQPWQGRILPLNYWRSQTYLSFVFKLFFIQILFTIELSIS